MARILTDKASSAQSAHVSEVQNPNPADRACARCGTALGRVHGNRKYHPHCAKAVRGDVAAEHSAAYRWRRMAINEQRFGARPPRAYNSAAVTVNGVALPGERVLELRAALHSYVLALLEQDKLLRLYTVDQMRREKGLLALRNFVDDGLHLVALLDMYLPIVNTHGQSDLLDLIDKKITELHSR